MERIAYTPPPGTQPFEYVHGGRVVVIQPPDAWWKRAKEDFVFTTIYHPATGTKIRDILKSRTIWVLDEEKTARGDRPDNTMWVSKNELGGLMAQRFSPLNQHVKRISEMDGRDAADLASREARHRADIKKQEAAQDREKKLYASKLEKELDAVRSDLQKKMAEQADSMGISIQALDDVMKEREAKLVVRAAAGKRARK